MATRPKSVRRTHRPAQRNSYRMGYDRHWSKFRWAMLNERAAYCAEHGVAICEQCEREGKGFSAQQFVDGHHKIPLRDRPDLKLVRANVEFLCRKHHSEAERNVSASV